MKPEKCPKPQIWTSSGSFFRIWQSTAERGSRKASRTGNDPASDAGRSAAMCLRIYNGSGKLILIWSLHFAIQCTVRQSTQPAHRERTGHWAESSHRTAFQNLCSVFQRNREHNSSQKNSCGSCYTLPRRSDRNNTPHKEYHPPDQENIYDPAYWKGCHILQRCIQFLYSVRCYSDTVCHKMNRVSHKSFFPGIFYKKRRCVHVI